MVMLAALAGCGANPADIEEIKKGQKDILAKLEALDKTVQQVKSAAPAAARPQVDPNKVYTLAIDGAPMKGPKEAKVTIVEFSDYQCPFCSQAEPLVDQVLEAYPKDVKRVYKQFPLTTIHPNALPASKAAVAAGKQGKFWEMHKKLFEHQKELSVDNYKAWAKELGLDVAKFEKDMDSPETQAAIDKDVADARAADVTGTPSIFVNGKRLMQRNIDGFKAVIDPILANKG
jgi:protein-disulfide isomerase